MEPEVAVTVTLLVPPGVLGDDEPPQATKTDTIASIAPPISICRNALRRFLPKQNNAKLHGIKAAKRGANAPPDLASL